MASDTAGLLHQPHETGGDPSRPSESAGLSLEEVELRRKHYGPNLLPQPPHPPIWRRLLSQLVHFFAVMLWVAGGLAILAGMPQLGFAIFVVIVVNGLFAFFQKYRAEKAGERLRDLLPRRVTVIREQRRQSIAAIELLPDDVVVLNAGDRISADICLAKVDGLSIDTSTLTGESVPTTPQPGESIFAGTSSNSSRYAVQGLPHSGLLLEPTFRSSRCSVWHPPVSRLTLAPSKNVGHSASRGTR